MLLMADAPVAWDEGEGDLRLGAAKAGPATTPPVSARAPLNTFRREARSVGAPSEGSVDMDGPWFASPAVGGRLRCNLITRRAAVLENCFPVCAPASRDVRIRAAPGAAAGRQPTHRRRWR